MTIGFIIVQDMQALINKISSWVVVVVSKPAHLGFISLDHGTAVAAAVKHGKVSEKETTE